MAYYIGTKTKCNNYDNKVIDGENYVSGDNWANPFEINGKWYILKHEKYTSEMQLVNELPPQNLELG